MKLRSAGLLAIGLLASAAPSPAQSYNVTDLGAVPGQNTSTGYGLNGLGQAAGASSSPSGDIATLFSNGQAINLGKLEPLDVSVGTGINLSGEVVGYEPFSSDPNGASHAWLYSNGKLLDIHSPSLFPYGTRAAAVNGSGVVVGQGLLTSSSFHAFVYVNGRMVDIGPPGSYQASAVGINEAGQVVGNSYFTSGGGGPFIYANGTFTFLAAPPGASVSAFAISSTGEVVGALYLSTGTHAALYSKGMWSDLGGIAGAANHATGVNTSGQIIGTAFFPQTSYHPPKPGKHVAFIIRSGGLVALNTLIPANSGFNVTDGIAINDAGDILCNGTNPSGAKRALLLTPK